MRFLQLFLFFSMVGYSLVATNMEVSGNIFTSTTWTGVDTVKVAGDVTVNDGATLTIDPGIIVEFQDRYGLLINGRLLAEGTVADSITFVPADTTGAYNFTHEGWRGIIFAQISVVADSSKISYCKFYYMSSLPLWSAGGYYNLGAISVDEYDKLTVNHSHFYNNFGLVAGGIHTTKSNIRITDCQFQNNLAKPESVAEVSQGGAICLWNNTATTKYATIERNKISNNKTLFGNVIYYGPGAGGIGCYQMNGRINANFITDNETEGNGGGLHLVGPEVPHISNNLIAGNAVITGAEPKYGNGGGVFLIDVNSISFVNNTIVNNSAVRSGGGFSIARIYETQTEMNLVNNIIVQNSAGGNPEQISLSAINSSYNIHVNLNLFKSNLEGGTDEIVLPGTYTTLSILNNEWIDVDSKFSMARDNLYELSVYSPLINVCDPDTTGLLLGNVDLLGNPRIYDNLVYDIIDMGAFEYQGEPSSHILPKNIYTNTLMSAQWDTIRCMWGCNIHDQAKLEFSPGNYVKFYDDRRLYVGGSVSAEGTTEAPIYFTIFDTTGFHNNTHAGWRGISIYSMMVDSIKFVHCVLEYGKGYEFLKLDLASDISFYIDSCTIRKCRQVNPVLYLSSAYSEFCLINSEISDNICSGGSFPYCCFLTRNYQDFTISNNLFSDNYTVSNGGALHFAFNSNWSNVAVSNNTFINNTSEADGGAIYISTTHSSTDDFTIVNSVFYGNTAGNDGDNIYYLVDSETPFHLENCLLEGELNNVSVDDPWNWGIRFYPERIMDADPLFARAGDRSYELSSLSPCINAGKMDTTGLNLPSVDMAGNPRIFDGCFDIVDIGCYEYQDEPGSLQYLYTSPDDDENVYVYNDTTLTVVFNNAISANNGDVSIYYSDGSLFESMDVNDTNCITIADNEVVINPDSPFQPKKNYYVHMDADAFMSCNNQYSGAIDDDTTWNFTLSGSDNYPLYALEFDGINDYVHGSGIVNSLSAITLEAWIKHTNISSAIQRYITIEPEVAVLRYDNYDLHFYVRASDGSFAAINKAFVPDPGVGNWFHLAGTYDGTTMQLYLNGELVGSNDTSGGLYEPDGGFLFSHITETLDGQLDEVVIWDYARTQEQIRENKHLTLHGDEEGLLYYWQCNNGSGSIAVDGTSGVNGTLYNMTDEDWITSSVPVGFGYSNSQVVSSMGVFDFAGTDFSVDFTQKIGTDTIVVNQLLVPPNTEPNGVDDVFDEQYWIVNTYGSGIYTGNVTFGIEEDLNYDDETEPSRIKLFWRDDVSHENWFLDGIANSVDALLEEATFNGLSDMSQYILGRYIEEIDAPLDVSIQIVGSNVLITWNEVAGANSYKIFAADSPDGEFMDITEEGILGTPVIAANGIQKSYNVRKRNQQSWSININEAEKKFYYVQASTETSSQKYKSNIEKLQNPFRK